LLLFFPIHAIPSNFEDRLEEKKNQSHTWLLTSPLLQLIYIKTAQLYQNIKGAIFKKVQVKAACPIK